MFRAMFAASLFACCAVQPASAEPLLPSRPVNVADLDLTSDSDRAKLDRRLQKAVFAVCGAKVVGDGVRNERVDQCRAETLANARRDAEVIIAAGTSGKRLADRGQ